MTSLWWLKDRSFLATGKGLPRCPFADPALLSALSPTGPSRRRALLAAVSPYFRDVFIKGGKELEGTEVQLQGVSPSIVQNILKYIYTEELALTPELAPLLFTGANQLQITPLQTVCCG